MSEKKIIALTFDDGPTIGITDQVLDILEEYNARASFFLIGQNIKPETEYLIKRAVSMGCTIENHTFTHPDMTKLTDEQMITEVKKTTDAIVNVIGEAPKFFRPPFILVNDRMYDLIDLTFISGHGCDDWIPAASAETRIEKILAAACDGAMILVHDMPGNVNTIEAIKVIIPMLQAEGYEFVNVREIFAAKDQPIDHKTIYSTF